MKTTACASRHPFGMVYIVAAISLLGMVGGSAQTNEYLFTGSQINIALNAGLYQITAYGAKGGNGSGSGNGYGSGGGGGLGAEMEGVFNFATPTTFTLLVGGAGGDGGGGYSGGGGGGGSFVVSGSTPLVVAAGGGGGAYFFHGFVGFYGTSGLSGGQAGGSGGYGGSGGGGGSYGGGGGGGFSGNGGNALVFGGGGGNGCVTGGAGGAGNGGGGGGYGGGGGGGNGAGGGGGYSGGGGGGIGYEGGGGGSIIDSSATMVLAKVAGVASPDDTSNGEVIITFIMSITNEPVSLAILSGDTARFTVGALSLLPLYYQWLVNGEVLTGQTNATLTLTGVPTNDNGNYSVVVTSPLGSVTSSSAMLTVYPTAAASITSAGFEGGQFRFNIVGVPGYSNVIQVSGDLLNWIPVLTNTAPFTFEDTDPPTRNRFYRAVYMSGSQ